MSSAEAHIHELICDEIFKQKLMDPKSHSRESQVNGKHKHQWS